MVSDRDFNRKSFPERWIPKSLINKPVVRPEPKPCSGCKKIYDDIDNGAEGIWNCSVCGREIEWGT